MLDNLKTDRLVLRHFKLGDAPRVRALVGNWKVARMLARVSFPYSEDDAQKWIAGHARARADGRRYPYAIEHDGELVGCIGLHAAHDGHVGGCGHTDKNDPIFEIGYWIGEPYWNRGFATEAGRAMVRHAFEASSIKAMTAGHLAENHASGSVLTKLGFRYIAECDLWSEARREKVHALRMVLKREAAANVATGNGR